MYQFPKGVDESLGLNNSLLRLQKTTEIKQAAELEPMTVKKVEQLKLVKDIDEMKSKLNEIQLKLGEVSFDFLLCFSFFFFFFCCSFYTYEYNKPTSFKL